MMRAIGGIALIFTGILLLVTGWGAFAGIGLVIAGVAIWAWGVVGSQQDESLDAPDTGIVDPNESGEPPSGLINPNEDDSPLT